MSGGVTPPAQYPVGKAPKVVVNACSVNGYTPLTYAGVGHSGMLSVLSGVLSANTLTTMLNITGPGVLEYLDAIVAIANAKTVRCQLIIDGVTVFDSTSASTAAANVGCQIVGNASLVGGIYDVLTLGELPFYTSCVFKIASSVAETNGIYSSYQYRTTQ